MAINLDKESDVITFGLPDSQWQYTRSTKTYDLSRGKTKTLTMSTSAGKPDTKVKIATQTTALVIVDMQNFFLHPKCRDNPLGLKTVDPTIRAIKKCREAGIQIIWLNWALTDASVSLMPGGVLAGLCRDLILGQAPDLSSNFGHDPGNGQGRSLYTGSWNAAIYEPLAAYAQASDVHCGKTRLSGLWNEQQPLWRHLEESRVTTLLFAGVNTDRCVLGTLINAYSAGWDCVMIEDCCATPTEKGQEVCVFNTALLYGFVTSSSQFTQAESKETNS